jgi:hypothetical protein
VISPDDKVAALVLALQSFKPPRMDRTRIMRRSVPKRSKKVATRHRRGLVRDVVLLVLADCDRPARVKDIHGAACDLLSETVPSSSVRNWLRMQASAKTPLVERTSPGHYALAFTAAADANMISRARQRLGLASSR